VVNKREYWREKARLRRAIAKRIADEKSDSKRSRVRGILNRLGQIISDEKFVKLAADQGIQAAPARLFNSQPEVPPREIDMNLSVQAGTVLDFVIAWKFIFPMFSNPTIANYLETCWPGFILDFKDTFIALVMDGPFPQERRSQIRALT
jgi:hypothetical protein